MSPISKQSECEYCDEPGCCSGRHKAQSEELDDLARRQQYPGFGMKALWCRAAYVRNRRTQVKLERQKDTQVVEAQIDVAHPPCGFAIMLNNTTFARTVSAEPTCSVREPSASILSLRDLNSVQVPTSARPRQCMRVFSPKSSISVHSPKMEESGIEVSVKEPEPELSFVQKLDLRELEDQRSMDTISEEKYKQKKNEICTVFDYE